MILLDTNVISELLRPSPNSAVVSLLRRGRTTYLFAQSARPRSDTASPAGRRRGDLTARIAAFLASGFENRILPFDSTCAALYGEIRARREARGRPIAVEDAMIAAIAGVYGALLATRNIGDFEDCGIAIVNPWRDA